MKFFLKKAFPKLVYSYLSFRHPVRKQIVNLINHYHIDLLLDIGANIGQYAHSVRNLGYKGRIISFEPLSDAFSLLNKNAKTDKNWDVSNFALGDYDGETEINVSENSVSSSLLNIKSETLQIVPNAKYTKKEKIQIRRLDSIIEKFCQTEARIFLKIDAQGYEKKVLEGSKKIMDKIIGIQLELSLSNCYEKQVSYLEMLNYLLNLNFEIMQVEPGFINPLNGRLLEMDGIFFKNV